MPHSCNAICGKTRGAGCTHPCTDQCHPGPCSECALTIIQKCNCGRQIIAGRCGKQLEFKCSMVCGKMLNCGLHKCEMICHQGECNVCEHVITQKCFCGLEERIVPCTVQNLQVTSFSCGAPCTGMYACNIHKCELRCHDKYGRDDCGLCSLSPQKREYCPCGRTPIVEIRKEVRTSCTDPIPTCKNVCGKVLLCGPKDKPHRCMQLCHTGSCSQCPSNTSINCRCKALKKIIPCKEFVLYSAENPYLCVRRCKKLKTCQNHRCQAICCVDEEHVCMQIRSNIPCFLNDVSCGRPCDKKLLCSVHRCKRICHPGECLVNNASCQQPCTKRRVGETCDHICGLPCHGDTSCPKIKMVVTCSCLRKSSEMRCSDVEKAYQKLLSLKIMENNYSNLSAEKPLLKRSLSMDKYHCLPCDVECQRALRNKKVAEILNISYSSAVDAISYTTFLKNKVETDYKEISDIEDTLIELVHDLNAQPNITSVSHSFPPMHSEMRRIIHEYSGYFGIETISHGQEPRRNVVATAKR
ncbi:NF-X1 type zinc finger [Onchocerca flexuosa]|uniref:NF-X1 type zinc finger n=1 Tax=Onchocerca flexuosa TaxID=387005 RepID=A0A238C3Y5_9BILA|nr:NF-X1 type zinc finger [Onchocerca flexuosa]